MSLFDDLFGGDHLKRPAKCTMRGATRIYVDPDKIIAERGSDNSHQSTKVEYGKFDPKDVLAVEKETRSSKSKNGRPIFFRC
jgi:hypothetical protein